MPSSFNTHFGNFIFSRTEEVSRKLVSVNFEYLQLSDRSAGLYQRISANLPGEARELLDEYDSVANLMRGLAYDAMYEQGLKDGFKLFHSLTIK